MYPPFVSSGYDWVKVMQQDALFNLPKNKHILWIKKPRTSNGGVLHSERFPICRLENELLVINLQPSNNDGLELEFKKLLFSKDQKRT